MLLGTHLSEVSRWWQLGAVKRVTLKMGVGSRIGFEWTPSNQPEFSESIEFESLLHHIIWFW